MARPLKHARLENPNARAKLERGRNAHMQSLIPDRAALGYQRAEDADAGRWFLRRSLGGHKFQTVPLGRADDVRGIPADGVTVLDYEQAKDLALDKLGQGAAVKGNLTVTKALAAYVTRLQAEGKDTTLMEQRAAKLILPELGGLRVEDLTTDRLRKWLTGMVARPALQRSSKKDGAKQNTKPAPGKDTEEIRKRRASANRVWTILRAALNNAFHEGLVLSDAAWRRVRPFADVDQAKVEYLEVDEAKRLINAAPEDFRKMVHAALQSGARYGELARLKVSDFSPSAGTLLIARSKSGKARHIMLSQEGINFFRSVTQGRKGNEIMLQHEGREWRHGEQSRAMREATEAAKLRPVGFHILRHTWASLSVMGGMPLEVVQQNLGHADLRMTTKHYAHLSPSYRKDVVKAHAPTFGFKPDKKVTPLRRN